VLNLDNIEVEINKLFITLLVGKEGDLIQKKNVYPILNLYLYKLHMQSKLIKNHPIEEI